VRIASSVKLSTQDFLDGATTMKTAPLPKARPKPLILNSKEEAILRAVYELHNATALDLTHLLFSKGSLTHVRSLLNRLAGGADHIPNSYLYRFQPPTTSIGKVYVLGAKGRALIAQERGEPPEHSRSYKARPFSYSHIFHHLSVTRFVCAANYWCRTREDVRLVQTRLGYELARTLAMVAAGKKDKSAPLPVADAWLLFESLQGGVHKHFMPIWLEVECGSKGSLRFKRDLRNRIEFIQSGGYRKLFETEAVAIAYVITGDLPEHLDNKRRAISKLTMEVLKELGKASWASSFRFHSLCLADYYKSDIFSEPVWYQPNSPKPVPLFAP
jgi:protein involved in plasmid replication-relaxation